MGIVMEVLKKEKEYKLYIEEHIENVRKAFKEIINSEDDYIKMMLTDEKTFKSLETAVKNHDKSKYSAEEFQAYRKNFFPINEEEKQNNKEAFDKAWEHHWTNNTHHWQNREGSEEVNVVAVFEMIIDWMAMGYKFNDTAIEYYKKNKEEIKLNEYEREITEAILKAFYKEEI